MFNNQSFIFNISTDLQDSQSYKLYSNLKKHLQFYTDVLADFINNYNMIKATNTVYKQKKLKKSIAKANAEEPIIEEEEEVEAIEEESPQEEPAEESPQEEPPQEELPQEEPPQESLQEEPAEEAIEAVQESPQEPPQEEAIEAVQEKAIEAEEAEEPLREEAEKAEEQLDIAVPNKTKKYKRCPNGKRRNKVTKKCEPYKK
jgi:hypothetical protein